MLQNELMGLVILIIFNGFHMGHSCKISQCRYIVLLGNIQLDYWDVINAMKEGKRSIIDVIVTGECQLIIRATNRYQYANKMAKYAQKIQFQVHVKS